MRNEVKDSIKRVANTKTNKKPTCHALQNYKLRGNFLLSGLMKTSREELKD